MIEVLVAIFVMAIGLMALLALFPLGVLRMGKAIQDERTAETAQQASLIGASKNFRFDPYYFPRGVHKTNPNDIKQYDYFNNPEKADWVNRLGVQPESDPFNYNPPYVQDAHPQGPSFPIMLDPIGFMTTFGLTPGQAWVGATKPKSNYNLARVTLDFFDFKKYPSVNPSDTPSRSGYEWFVMRDELFFDSEFDPTAPLPKYPGKARLVNTTPLLIERDIRYTYAYMLQRPRNADKSVVNMTVMVFNQRPLSLTGNLSLNETLFASQKAPTFTKYDLDSLFDRNTNCIYLPYKLPEDRPNIRPGEWLFDCTVERAHNLNLGEPLLPQQPTPWALPHGKFHRIVAVDDEPFPPDPTIASLKCQVEEKLLRSRIGELNPIALPSTLEVYAGQVLYFEGLVEVFDKGPLTVR